MSVAGIGVAGAGFMGRRHAINAFRLAEQGVSCRLVSVCSPGVSSLDDLTRGSDAGNIEAPDGGWPSGCAPRIAPTYTDMLRDDDVGLVVVATPTPLHIEMAIRALEAGKHVFVEKPLALTEREIQPLAECAARHPTQRCMPAHVMRFWPGWMDLVERVRDKRYGRVLSATFRRLGSMPGWNQEFYGDTEQSGGALVDLHLHDVDFILHCFGEPSGVHAVGNLMHVTGSYTFEDGPNHVTAEAAWDQQPGAGFRMSFIVNFERATMEFDSSERTPLRVMEGERVTAAESSAGDGYETELRAMIESIVENTHCPVTIDDASRAARVLDRERDILVGTKGSA